MTINEIRLPSSVVSDDENRTLNRLLQQLDAKKSRNLLRASYYDGKRAVSQISAVMPPQYLKLGIVLGWSARAVDILARRCNLDGFVWPDSDLDSLGYQEVYENNDFSTESNSAMVSSLIHGPAFLVNTTGLDGEPKSLIHVKDALNATGDWNARTRRLDNLLSITAREKVNDNNEITGLALYLDGETITAQKKAGKWEADRQEHHWGVPVEVLTYRSRVGRPLGGSRISRPVMALHDMALRTVIRLEGHADVYSYPELWMLGADPSIFKDEHGNQLPHWKVMLGRVKGIPDNENADDPQLARADIKQFQAASPQPHLDALRQHAQLFSGETSIPLSSLGISDKGNPTSADSYIASREDLIAEAEGATDDWAPAFRRSMIRALAIQNDMQSIPQQWKTIDTKFRSPVYLSRAAQADAGMKQLAAIPWLAETEVGMELVGMTDQQIRRGMASKRQSTVTELVNGLRAAATKTDENISGPTDVSS